MAVAQSTYAQSLAVGFPGMVANGEDSNRISRTVEDVAGLAYGRAVFRGAGDHGCTATPSATAGAFLGIALSNVAVTPVPGGVAADVYPQYASAGILNEGVVWVTAGATVTQGQAAYVTSAGVVTNSSSGNTAIPAVFDHGAASGAMVRLRVRRA